MPIRPATPLDSQRMALLSDQKRSEYEHYAPTFWRKAPDIIGPHAAYLANVLNQENVIGLVHQNAQEIDGFVVATLTAAPPVYAPGTGVCVVDDFTVDQPEKWPGVGLELLTEVRRVALERGAGVMVVACAHLDEPKRAALREAGFGIASEWYVNPL